MTFSLVFLLKMGKLHFSDCLRNKARSPTLSFAFCNLYDSTSNILKTFWILNILNLNTLTWEDRASLMLKWSLFLNSWIQELLHLGLFTRLRGFHFEKPLISWHRSKGLQELKCKWDMNGTFDIQYSPDYLTLANSHILLNSHACSGHTSPPLIKM